jgi:hypothetical protein
VLANRVLRRIFGPKRDEVIESWRKLHNELHNLFFTKQNYNYEVKKNEMGRVYSTYGREDKCVHNFGYKSRGKETTRKTKT